jgi:AraC-like DNA-binding protein
MTDRAVGAVERIEHVSGHGRWSLIRRAPPAALGPYILGYCGYEERGGRPVWRREIASTTVPLIFNFDEPWDIAELDRVGARPFLRSFVAGLHDRPVLVGSRGQATSLQVDLTPLGAARLLGGALAVLSGSTVALRDVVGVAADRLDDALHAAPSWTARFDLLDRLLLRCLDRAKLHPLAVAALAAIEGSRGAVAIGALAASLEVSRKHLDETVRRTFGLPPKRIARLVRFSAAASALGAAPPGSLADLALAQGYFDQAHLNRDFRELAGESPLAYRARCLADGTGAIER